MKTILFLLLAFSFVCVNGTTGPLTSHFQTWINNNGYLSYDFVRNDYGTQGSYGGLSNSSQRILRNPVVFLHGNSDSALQTTAFATGWDNSIDYFLSQGYTTGELYAISWQDNKAARAGTRTHDCNDLKRLRKFVEAVFKYTGASSISIIGHSMGVTLGRKVIQGGIVNATDGICDLGPSIALKIDVFIGISGANYGLCSCTGVFSAFSATCNKKNGFWPGDSCGSFASSFCGLATVSCNGASSYSNFLSTLNQSGQKAAANVFSMWSKADDLINNADLVWGQPTSLVPLSDGKIIYDSLTHMQSKEDTAKDQYRLITQKKV